MTTQKQIEANRRNAARSTGPRTDAGPQNCVSGFDKFCLPTSADQIVSACGTDLTKLFNSQ